MFSTESIAKASADVERLQRKLDITNADHIALWLENNLPDASIAWLACRIVEAHEVATPAPPVDETDRLRDMSEAPKDGRYILAQYKSLDGYAESLDGRAFVVRHEGTTPSGLDLGWGLFPGHGGVPDKCFFGWLPLPAALADRTQEVHP